jgi:hypothetical protein
MGGTHNWYDDLDEEPAGEWIDCWQCGGEAWFHDCGEDCCPCLEPEADTPCSECKGAGGWHVQPKTG